MQKQIFTSFFLVCLFNCASNRVNAQFISDSSQTYFICDATGSQTSVSAFDDGSGGTYSFWIDKRNGTSGTAIYGQHLDSLGVPAWAANGKLFFQENGKEIWLMKAVPWQSGILIGWVQGPLGIGGDTLFMNYYNGNGVSQWAQPVVAANKQGNIIYVSIDDMDIFPNDSGASVVFALTPSGGNNYFSFNRIDFSGNLRWPLDTFSYQGNGYYYHTGDDHHNGFYVATSTGGLGYDIYLGHFDLQGNLTIPSPVDVCGTAGGRGNSQWKVICDADGNGYIVWACNTSSDIAISKIHPDGTLPWPDAKKICAAAGLQDVPDAIIVNDVIYSIWDDSRPGCIGISDIYMQKMDTAGNSLWTPDGILLSHLSSYLPYPKLAVSGNDLAAGYVVNSGFRAQKIHPDSTISWYQNGAVINVNNPPFYGDFQLVSSASGSVTAIWHESGDNICGVRVKPNGLLTTIQEANEKSIQFYPNPAHDHFAVNASVKPGSEINITIYNSTGEQVYSSSEKVNSNKFSKIISLNNFTQGIYTVHFQSAEFSENKILLKY